SQQGLAGEASRLYLFINLLGTGNERQGENTIPSVARVRKKVYVGGGAPPGAPSCK
ncbi:unnamed protein product, partial [Tetraodon nigroviridis]